MDDRTKEFLSIVDCAPEDVRDIPPDRVGVHPLYIPPDARMSAMGSTEIHFGKYKGNQFKDVPRSYLKWLAAQPRLKEFPQAERTKRKIRLYLATTERK